jgi:hypothetical protein
MKTSKAVATPDLMMFREYARGSGEYVGTNLTIRGTNGKTAYVYDLSPAEIGQLTRAGIKKL